MFGKGVPRAEPGRRREPFRVRLAEGELDDFLFPLPNDGKGDFVSALFGAHEQREVLGRDEVLIFEEGDDVVVPQSGRAGGGVGHDLDDLDAESLGDLEMVAQDGVDRSCGHADPNAFLDGVWLARPRWLFFFCNIARVTIFRTRPFHWCHFFLPGSRSNGQEN